MTAAPLTRKELARRTDSPDAASAPARIVHFGLGHFFRAHQAWYTARAVDAAQWGIVAFTGRSLHPAATLAAQDGLFCLVQRGSENDRMEVITSLVESRPGADTNRLCQLAEDPRVAVVTLTVTEHGYRLTTEGRPDLTDPEVVADLDDLRGGRTGGRSVIGRLTTFLVARRRAHAGPIAVVPCDNIPRNGEFVRRGVTEFARSVDPALVAWIEANVSFVSTSVDRITPHVQEMPASVADAGWIDHAAVVTEPFSDWVLAGDFPAGRPAWETAGARFVDDIDPWEHRKLWLLNGAHTLLAVAGLPKGLDTVAEAIMDTECRALVDAFWEEAVACLPEGTEHVVYRAHLLERFANPRIVHHLAQIAAETTVKVQFRFAAVAEASCADGRSWRASARAFAAWTDWLLTHPIATDARADDIAAAEAADDRTRALIALVSPTLARCGAFVADVRAAAQA